MCRITNAVNVSITKLLAHLVKHIHNHLDIFFGGDVLQPVGIELDPELKIAVLRKSQICQIAINEYHILQRHVITIRADDLREEDYL
jgi:hypothetical protein